VKIEGCCHCGLVTYEAEVDPESGVGAGLIFLLTQHRLGQRDRQDKGKRRQ
jgi:hypothetical protein